MGEKSEIGLIKNKNKGSGKVYTKVGWRTGQTGTLCSSNVYMYGVYVIK